MDNFKYTLDKSSKKHICPNCNKKTFVLYADTETGEYLPYDFGRCDRETNCSHHKAPPKGKKAYLIAYLALTNITDKAYKLVDLNGVISIIPKSQVLELQDKKCFISEWYLKTSTINYLSCECKYFTIDGIGFVNEIKKTKAPEPKAPSFHGLELLDNMYRNKNQSNFFVDFLNKTFAPEKVFLAMENYFLTGTNHFWNNATVFWQIDNKEQVHAGKIMLYNPKDGKRIKEPSSCINWVHNAIKEPNFNLCQCLFGLHRISEDPQKTIAIVESEKTAVILSIFLPDFIWLATGSKSNFKAELLEPLKKRNIIAFPDKGEFIDWNKKATEMIASGFKLAVSELIEQTDFKNGFDLADYYLNQLKA